MSAETKKQLAFLLLGFGGLCLITTLFLSTGSTLLDTKFPKGNIEVEVKKRNYKVDMGVAGPIEIDKAGKVLEMEVHHDVTTNNWSHVSVHLLDENKEYITGFGEELWHETGYDSGGRWEEAKEQYSMNMTVPEAGTYYLKMIEETDMKKRHLGRKARLIVSTQQGSTVHIKVAGFVSLALGFLFMMFAGKATNEEGLGL